jgi:hypothetical protein
MNNIGDFVGRKNIILKAVNPSLVAGQNAWLSWYGHKFPSFIFILSVVQSGTGRVSITYFTRHGNYFANVCVPSHFKVRLIAESIPNKIIDKFAMKNMRQLIQRLGMSIGTDPEMFVTKKDGELIPAFNFLAGKEKPTAFAVTVPGSNVGGSAIYWDGFQAEFRTKETTCLQYQTDSVQFGLKGLLIAARKFDPTATISHKTVFEIHPQLLTEGKEEHVQFGCMPSLNAYGMSGKGGNGREITFRPAGGHIHFGLANYAKYTPDDYKKMVKALDAILGVACVSLFATMDNPQRRELYGLAGEYRLPPHGMEYRTLSNAWLCHPMIMNLVFDVGRICCAIGYRDLLRYWKSTEEETIKCINTCDVKLAREILKRNYDLFKILTTVAYSAFKPEQIETIFDIFYKGAEYAIKDPTNIVKNWSLEGEWKTQALNENAGVWSTIPTVSSGKKVA